MTHRTKIARCAGLAASALLLALVGCGTPGAPLPPSLRLPAPITDLTTTRAGDLVTVRWTNPTRTTDKQSITAFQQEMEADLCRSESAPATAAKTSAASVHCLPVLQQTVKPGKETTLTDALPPSLTSGAPRPLFYWVLLLNLKARTAGPSNVAVVAAGTAPSAVVGLVATASADGVILHWQADGNAVPVRLHRHVLRTAKPNSSALTRPSQSSITAPPPEPADEDLIVDHPASSGIAGAIDREARFDEQYSYTAQRVVTLPGQSAQSVATKSTTTKFAATKFTVKDTTNTSVLELAGFVSAPVVVATTDIFAPAVPHGLGVIYSAATRTMDLSWVPNTEPDLAGYLVDRSRDGGPWQQISPANPVTVPAYSDTAAQPGHSYRYAVRAVDTHGNRSARSDPTQAFATP